MGVIFEVKSYHLKTLSGVLQDLVAGFILAALGSRNIVVLTGDIFFAILCLLVSIKLEKLLEEL